MLKEESRCAIDREQWDVRLPSTVTKNFQVFLVSYLDPILVDETFVREVKKGKIVCDDLDLLAKCSELSGFFESSG